MIRGTGAHDASWGGSADRAGLRADHWDCGALSLQLCRLSYLSRKVKQLAPLGGRDPLHSLVKPRRNVELDHQCHSHPPIRFSFDNQGESNPDAKVVMTVSD